MNRFLLVKRSLVILERCLGLRPPEDLLILHDETIEDSLIHSLASASAVIGAETCTMSYIPKRWSYEREFSQFGGAWKLEDLVPRAVAGAISSADRIVIISSDMDLFFAPVFRELKSRGVRVLLLPYITTRERFFRLMPESRQEIDAVKKKTEAYRDLLDQAGEAHLTSRAGTDLRLALGDYRTGCNKGVFEGEGGFSAGVELLPCGQAIRVPNKGSARGKVVLDRSLMGHEFAKLHEAIELTVENGYVVDIQGGSEARRFRSFMHKWDDPEIYNVTELGVGTNPRCKFAGLVAPAEDTHTEGMATVAFGSDTHLGGDTRAACHIDSTMWEPSLALDGKKVVEDGRLLV